MVFFQLQQLNQVLDDASELADATETEVEAVTGEVVRRRVRF